MEIDVSRQLAVLGHTHRLAIFRLLMRRYPDRVAAGELAEALSLKPSTLSAYLSSLMLVGLVDQTRCGTSLRYAIDMSAARKTFDYLFNDCCRGRPALCQSPYPAPAPGFSTPMSKSSPWRVLFVCTGNSARSIMAESILRELAADRFTVGSAGSQPAAHPNPIALDVLRERGHDVSGLQCRPIIDFQESDAPVFDFVFTVCDKAANEECPAWRGQPVCGHWGLPDPVAVPGTVTEKRLAFEQTYAALHHRIADFVAQPIATLDRVTLQQAVDDIGLYPREALQ